MMKKKIIKKAGATIDASVISAATEKFKLSQLVNSAGIEDEELKSNLIAYLELTKKLLVDLEHSKMTVSKLQNLFGFSTIPVHSKEV